MERLTLDTARGRRLSAHYYETIQAHGLRMLSDVYNSASCSKQVAYDRCLDMLYKHDGGCGTIVSYNTFTFTYGFEYTSPDDGVVHVVIITPSHDYDIEQVRG